MSNLDDATLKEVLPNFLADTFEIQTICAGIDSEVAIIGAGAEIPNTLSTENIALMLANELDHIAWGWRDHIWSNAWSIETKRQWILTTLAKKRRMGTIQNLRDIFESRGYDVTVADCMTQANIPPANFRVSLVNQPITAELLTELDYIIQQSKPASRWYVLGTQRVDNLEVKTIAFGGSNIWVTSKGELAIPEITVAFLVAGFLDGNNVPVDNLAGFLE